MQLQTTKEIPKVVLTYTDATELATQVVAHIEVLVISSCCLVLLEVLHTFYIILFSLICFYLCSPRKPICRKVSRKCMEI